MVEKTDSGRMAEEIKQAIPSPEDRVRAIREKLENVKSGRWHKTLWTESAPEDVAYLLSLVEELILFCNSPCGHTSQYAYSEDGGKNIVCLICEREELKGQVASASPQPMCPICHATDLTIYTSPSATVRVHCSDDQTHPAFYLDTVADCAQFFPAAPATEAALLRKRKDYHAEYVEAVEAAVKTQGELGVMREALQEIASYEDEIFAKQIALKALTPEPASQAVKEKK